MENPLNPQGARRADHSASVQFADARGKASLQRLKMVGRERSALESRLAFIWDNLSEKHPTLFRRRNYPLNPTQVAARLGLT